MTTEAQSRRLDVRGTPVEVVRKNIKHLHLGVYPPEGRVRVAAPIYVDDDAVRLAVVARLGWIRRRQAEFRGQDRQSQRRLVSGESHYVDGRRYRLAVTEQDAPPAVRLRNRTTMELRIRPNTDRAARAAVIPGRHFVGLEQRQRLHLRALVQCCPEHGPGFHRQR